MKGNITILNLIVQEPVCLVLGRREPERKLLPEEVIRLIRHQALLKPADSQDANIGWELTLMIPFKAFHYHHIKMLKGQTVPGKFL